MLLDQGLLDLGIQGIEAPRFQGFCLLTLSVFGDSLCVRTYNGNHTE